jgi:hypothetical protein
MHRFVLFVLVSLLLVVPAASTASPELYTSDQLKTRR